MTGDKNPVHLDEAFAAKTMFKTRIAHGMLTASYISAVFGMELPGPGVIYVSQTLNFRGPVKIGDRVIAKVKVAELFPAKRRARFDCICTVDGKAVLEGEADADGSGAARVNRRSARQVLRDAQTICDAVQA